jgi:hypothetical protein
MFYVGLDIHTKRISVCVLNEAGQIAHRSQVRSIEEMLRILGSLHDRFEVCYEASCGYGHFHDLLRPLAARVLVAHPGQLRLIFRTARRVLRISARPKLTLPTFSALFSGVTKPAPCARSSNWIALRRRWLQPALARRLPASLGSENDPKKKNWSAEDFLLDTLLGGPQNTSHRSGSMAAFLI